MPDLTESELIERLCRTFNTRFSGNRNAMQSLAETIENSEMLHPGLRGLGGKAFLASFKGRMNVWQPGEIRVLVIDMLVSLMKEKVTTDSSKRELTAEIDGYLLPIKFW
jgi:hypothetical protein